MKALSPLALLEIVDGLADALPTERAVALWSRLEPDAPADALWTAPAGCLTHAMLDLREATRGSALELHDRCPACGEEIEFEVDVASLRLARPPRSNPPFDVEVDGQPFVLRRVSCEDLRAVERGESSDRLALLSRCIVGIVGDHGPLDAVAERLDAILGERDPQADITFALCCPACEHGWQGVFDACAVVWSELRTEATQLTYDVDAIARAYHWSEADILALPAVRRRRYLELIGG